MCAPTTDECKGTCRSADSIRCAVWQAHSDSHNHYKLNTTSAANGAGEREKRTTPADTMPGTSENARSTHT